MKWLELANCCTYKLFAFLLHTQLLLRKFRNLINSLLLKVFYSCNFLFYFIQYVQKKFPTAVRISPWMAALCSENVLGIIQNKRCYLYVNLKLIRQDLQIHQHWSSIPRCSWLFHRRFMSLRYFIDRSECLYSYFFFFPFVFTLIVTAYRCEDVEKKRAENSSAHAAK